MKKITETIKKWNKEQGKEELVSFDFFNKKEVIKKEYKDNKRLIKNIIHVFMLTQLSFGLANVNSVLNIGNAKMIETNQTYDNYKQFQQFVREGKQQDSVLAFSNLLQEKQPINDLLAGGFVLIMLTQNNDNEEKLTEKEKKLIEETRYHLTPETKSAILDIYNKNWNIGIKSNKTNVDQYHCMIVDLSCYALKNIYEYHSKKYMNVVENKINVTHYNINNIDQYKEWQKQNIEIIQQNQKNKDGQLPFKKSPGQLAFPQKQDED